MSRRRGDHARRLSEHERRELQRRVAEGETFASAAAAVGCSTKSIQRLLARTGGLGRRAPARSPLRLAPADREELSRGLVAGDSLRQIAGRLRPRRIDTLARGGAEWRAHQPIARATPKRRRRGGPAGRSQRNWPSTVAYGAKWSAGCSSGGLPSRSPRACVYDYPDDLAMRVSHETIYRTLFVQARGALRKELTACLRTQRTQRRSHKRSEHSGTGRTPGHGAHQRSAQRSRGPRNPWALGGRPAHGQRR